MFQVDLKLIVLIFTSVLSLTNVCLGYSWRIPGQWVCRLSPSLSLSLSFTFHWYALDRGDDGLTNWDEEWHWQQEVVTVDNDEWEQRQWTEIQLGRGLRTGITMPMNGDMERHCWNDDGGDNGEWGQWTMNRSHRTTDDNEQNDDNEQRRRKAGAVNTTTAPLPFLRVEMWDGFFLSFALHSWLTLRARARRVVFNLFYY